MKIKTIMTGEVACCGPDDSMSAAATLMWKNDCGIVPVVDNGGQRVLGVITDRDICMAALMCDQPLSRLPVRESMSGGVKSVHEDEDVRSVHQAMRDHQLRRVPVVDDEGRLAGIVSLNDLAVEAFASRGAAAAKRQRDVAKTLAAVCQHRMAETT